MDGSWQGDVDALRVERVWAHHLPALLDVLRMEHMWACHLPALLRQRPGLLAGVSDTALVRSNLDPSPSILQIFRQPAL